MANNEISKTEPSDVRRSSSDVKRSSSDVRGNRRKLDIGVSGHCMCTRPRALSARRVERISSVFERKSCFRIELTMVESPDFGSTFY